MSPTTTAAAELIARSNRLGWADRRRRGPRIQQLDDRSRELLVDGTDAALPARVGAVLHVVPVLLPLLAPLDLAPARGARLGCRGGSHAATLRRRADTGEGVAGVPQARGRYLLTVMVMRAVGWVVTPVPASYLVVETR